MVKINMTFREHRAEPGSVSLRLEQYLARQKAPPLFAFWLDDSKVIKLELTHTHPPNRVISADYI